jgi:hypothetical protein
MFITILCGFPKIDVASGQWSVISGQKEAGWQFEGGLVAAFFILGCLGRNQGGKSGIGGMVWLFQVEWRCDMCSDLAG